MATREFDAWQESWVLATEARKNMDKAYEELEKALQDEQAKWQANCDSLRPSKIFHRIVCNNSFKDFT